MWKNEYNTTISDVKSTIPPEDQRQTKFSMFVNLSWWKKFLLDGWSLTVETWNLLWSSSVKKKKKNTK